MKGSERGKKGQKWCLNSKAASTFEWGGNETEKVQFDMKKEL